MDLVKVSKKIAYRVQERFSDLKVDKPLSNLIEEEIKREYIGTVQSNQCTQNKIKTDKF